MDKVNGGAKVRKGKVCATCGRSVARDVDAIELTDGRFVCSGCEVVAYDSMMDADSGK